MYRIYGYGFIWKISTVDDSTWMVRMIVNPIDVEFENV